MTLEQETELGLVALKAITGIIDAVNHAKAGAVTPEDTIKQITSLHDMVKAHNESALQALHDKFDPG
jgi:hypothetical protein